MRENNQIHNKSKWLITVAKPSNDGTNKPPTDMLLPLMLCCIMNNNNFCACGGATYHCEIYL